MNPVLKTAVCCILATFAVGSAHEQNEGPIKKAKIMRTGPKFGHSAD
jgi:hypothetical protein